MPGSERERHCSYCHKNVHNLEALSAAERLALLRSPAATICTRYQVALRRPAPGRRNSYDQHLLKYGAGVAVAGSVLLVLWEMTDRYQRDGQGPAWFRAVAPSLISPPSMPPDLYVEHRVVFMGKLACPAPSPATCPTGLTSDQTPHVDIQLDLAQLPALEPPPAIAPELHVPIILESGKKRPASGRPSES